MIEVRDVSFAYSGAGKKAIENLHFQVRDGEIFGFLGPSGAGKSTTQKILIGLLREYEGAVSVLGRDLSNWGHDLYERIGVSFEVPNHYSKLTGLENLRYFGSLYQKPAAEPEQLLQMVGLENDGGMAVGQYSKGMKNRLNVARALLHDPELLFLDEPTAGLDPVNARRVKDLVRSQKESGKTIFLTTHNMSVADELCDRVAFIVDGRINLIDEPAELKLQYGQPDVRVLFESDGSMQWQDFPMEGLADNAAFLELLRSSRVRTIHSQEATLENIFIQVTGRSLT